MHQQLWKYKVEEKLLLGVREQRRLNAAELDDWTFLTDISPEKREDRQSTALTVSVIATILSVGRSFGHTVVRIKS
jgi:hypothetical protein